MKKPFRYFKTSSEIIRLAVLMYVRYPLSLRQVEDILHERGIDVSYETNRTCRNRFGPLFAAEIRKAKTLQKFVSIRSSVHNHFNLERHLTSRQQFKLNREAALTDWRQFAA